MTNTYNIIIINKNPVFLKAVLSLLGADYRFKVIDVFSSFNKFLNYLAKENPDIALIDIDMLNDPLDLVVVKIKEQSNTVKLIAMTNYEEELYQHMLIRYGYNALVPKALIPELLVQTIENILNSSSTLQ